MVETETSKHVPMTDERRSRGSSAPGSRSRASSGSVLIWLNLVCLDAPLVAISWQWLFARTFRVQVIAANASALFLTAWLIYLVDRLGDSILLRRGMPMSLRQEFCLRHRKLWLLATGLVSIVDLAVITRLGFRTIATGTSLGVVALAYLIVNHRSSWLWRMIPAKEMIIGFLFAAGTIISLAPRFPGVNAPLVLASFLFACLCSLNCMCIARWECELDRAQNRSSLATAWPTLARAVSVAPVALAVGALALAMLYRADITLFLSLSLSALALLLLDRLGNQLLTDTRTACADLALLAPLFILLIR